MRPLSKLVVIAAIALGTIAIYGTHAARQRDAAVRAQSSQARFVLFEKFSRKS